MNERVEDEAERVRQVDKENDIEVVDSSSEGSERNGEEARAPESDIEVVDKEPAETNTEEFERPNSEPSDIEIVEERKKEDIFS